MEFIRTERGWAGHFICAQSCLFRRNTLLEYGQKRIVISTVGCMKFPNENKIAEIGANRYYETMCFHAKKFDNKYWDADVTKQIYFESSWAIGNPYEDDKANDMHENVVKEITNKLLNGEL